MKIVQIQLEQIVLLTSEEESDSDSQNQLNKSSKLEKSNRSNSRLSKRKSSLRPSTNRPSSNMTDKMNAKRLNTFKALQLIQGNLPQAKEGKEPKAK